MALMGSIYKESRSAEEVAALKSTAISELELIVGKQWVTGDPLILDTYSWQYVAELMTGGSNYMERPLAVAMPADTAGVASIVKSCNRLGCQYKAISTGFGAWGAATRPDFVVIIDLRRMDRIIKIDTKNMYAVIEPYVTGNQLQTETMKHGLNVHMAGVGGQGSVLASQTAMMGQSWDGISLGFSARNLLGVEWVLPDGETVTIGSFDFDGEYWSGDGPGLSMRGVLRGFAGTMGGLGVVTRCAVKLYPWYGPEKLEFLGTSPDICCRMPANCEAGLFVVESWDQLAEIGYRLAEADIIDYLGRNAPSLINAIFTLDNNAFVDLYRIPVMKAFQYAMGFIIIGQDRQDFDYKLNTLKSIVKSVKGGLMLSGFSLSKIYWTLRSVNVLSNLIGYGDVIRSIPGLLKLLKSFVRRFGKNGLDYFNTIMFEALVRNGMQMRGVFRFGGSFHTAMGSLVSWDCSIRAAKVGEQVKRKYIEEGVLFDDGGDNAWGGLYEGGAYSHLEELGCYDPLDAYCRERANDYCVDSNLACIDFHLGDCINGIGPSNHLMFSPVCYNYDLWQQKIKSALDPNNASDPSFYTIPGYHENPPAEVVESHERVRNNRARVILED